MLSSVLFFSVIMGIIFVALGLSLYYGSRSNKEDAMPNTAFNLEPTPPSAEKRPEEVTQHGDTRVDNYAWLKDTNWQEVLKEPETLSEDIRAYLDAENAYTDAVMAPTKALQEKLVAEMRGRMKEQDNSAPYPHGPYMYYVRYEEGKEYPIYCRKEKGTDAEEVLLDVNQAAEGHDFFKVVATSISPDHRFFAYAVDTKGSEFYTLRIVDTTTGEELPERVENTAGSFEWAIDSQTLVYVRRDEETQRSKWVYRHTIGTREDDVLLYTEKDDAFFVGVGRTSDDRYLMINTHDHTTSETWLMDATTPQENNLQVVEPRQKDVEYHVDSHPQGLYILTNRDGAVDFKLMMTAHDKLAADNWVEVLPYEAGSLLEDFSLFKDWLVVRHMRNALPEYFVINLNTQETYLISQPEEAYTLRPGTNAEFDTNTFRFVYASPSTPARVYDYDMTTQQRVLVKEQEIPSGHNPDDYTVKRVFARGHDGTPIPLTVLYHNDTPLDGSAPLLLYGYGSYGLSMSAAFNDSLFSLVDRGIIYVVAHIRGGMEMGYSWYTAAKQNLKKNTFKDFISAAEYLVDNNYTRAGNIAIRGGSAGGMLMGAVVNMRPELFKCVVAQVPFVDVLNTMSDASLPLTPPEWPEWGNPINNKWDYDYIKSYSPYDNVTAKDYPHILVTAGLTDPRVTYWEPAKWVAKLRELKTDDHVLLMHMNMGAGHSGTTGRFAGLEEIALWQAFVLTCFDLS